MRILLTSLAIFGMATACTTESEYVPKKIEDGMEEELGKTEGGKYGYNKDGEVIIQKEKDPAFELMITKRANENLFLELERDAFDLDNCIQEYSDPSVNGDGKFKRVDDYESLRPQYASNEELGVDEEGKLKLVEKGYFKEQLVEAKSQMQTIKKMLRFVQKELRKCRTELKYKKQ